MKATRKAKTILLSVLILLLAATASAAAEGGQVRVAILPFTMNTPQELAYLQDGIRDMLASRLAWKDKILVVDRTSTEQALKSLKSAPNESNASQIGEALKADYVLLGSITAVGQSLSIDARMIPIEGASEPVSLYAQTNSLDEVIPKVNQFAQDINRKLFNRQVETAGLPAQDQSQLFTTRNPELLVPETMVAGDKLSYLNPNFIEVTPEGSLRQSGLWRSQTFPYGIVAMDVGDVDKDGRQELVAASYDKITVFKREANALRTVAVYRGNNQSRFTWVCVADANHDGTDEIYVTDMRRYNHPGGTNMADNINYGADAERKPLGFGLGLVGGQLQPVSDEQPYYLNSISLSNRGRVLIGQARTSDGGFAPSIYEMQVKGSHLSEMAPMNLPRHCTVFNFAKADINGDKADEYIVIDNQNKLLILDSTGTLISKTSRHFAATSNSILGKVTDQRYNFVDYHYLPSPIVVTDLNKDTIPEVIVNRSPDYGGLLPEGLKYYERGEIMSLSWDQMGMVENWKTREIGGMVTSIRVADISNDGVPELIASLVMGKDMMRLWETRSTIFCYDLNIAPSKGDKTAKKP